MRKVALIIDVTVPLLGKRISLDFVASLLPFFIVWTKAF
jgi:hypothetical protein